MNVNALGQHCSGAVLLPESAGYDTACRCWNTAVTLHPAVIVVATSIADLQAAAEFASSNRLKILVQSTGHGATPQTGNYLLIVTTLMKRITIDAVAQTACIEAGAVWGDVLREAQLHGLAPLLGSSATVGVVGYTLGGGIGWLARKYGLAVDSVRSMHVVTTNGEHVHTSAHEHQDLYDAMRAGSASPAIVASLEMQLYPVTTVWGGSLLYPIEHAAEALTRFREWTALLPEAMTSSIAIVNVPDVPEIPADLRGTSAVVVKGCYCGDVSDGQALTSYWTNWMQPTFNTFAAMPFANVASISNDPVSPVPAFAAGGDVLTELSDEAIAILVQYAARNAITNTGRSPFIETEVRHVDSAAVHVSRVSNAYGLRDARFVLDIVASVPTPESVATLREYAAEFERALRPHTSGGVYRNLTEAAGRVIGDIG